MDSDLETEIEEVKLAMSSLDFVSSSGGQLILFMYLLVYVKLSSCYKCPGHLAHDYREVVWLCHSEMKEVKMICLM